RTGCEATRREAIGCTDVHVLAFDAPVVVDRPFDTAAERPSGPGLTGVSRCDDPITAPDGDVLARVRHGGLDLNECNAALHVEERAVPGISQAAGDHPVSSWASCRLPYLAAGSRGAYDQWDGNDSPQSWSRRGRNVLHRNRTGDTLRDAID